MLDARNLGGDAQTDSTPPHLGQADGAATAIRLVGLAGLARTQHVDGLGQIAIPFQGVHREVKVGVEEEHGEKLLKADPYANSA